MYLVRDKKTKEIIHINSAPLSQSLEGEEVYYLFDPKKMEIGKTDTYEIPEHFNINEQGEIVAFTLQELVGAGFLALKPDEKIVDNEIVTKSLSEKVKEGLVRLPPTFKIAGKGENEEIVEKSLSEQVADGLLVLSPTQKLVGEGENEQIVDEPEALPVDGKSLRELYDEGLMTLDEVKRAKIEEFAEVAHEKRRKIIPDYRLQNAALGIYDDKTVATFRTTIQAYRAEFRRLEALITNATTMEAIETITDNYPTALFVGDA